MFIKNKVLILCCAILPWAMVACSNDESKPLSELGGASEETEIIADQDTTQNTVKNNRVFYFRQAAPNSLFFKNNGVSMLSKHVFDMAIIYELDTNYLRPTGNAVLSLHVDHDERYPDYQIQFDSIPFKSPYAMIELGYRDSYKGIKTKRAIIDLRDTSNIYINALTNMVSYRLDYASLEDSTFAEQKTKAERELLLALEVYDNFSNFEKESSFNDSNLVFIEEALSQLLIKDEEDVLFTSFNSEGNFEHATNSILDTLLKYITNIEKIDLEIVNRAGEPWATPFYEQQRLNQFYINLVAAMHKAGQCTNAEEGKIVELDKENLHIICRSGAWKIFIKPIPHSFDSIVDPRDGNVYKTVTIDMDGTTQTWMAEDLAYAADGSHCSRDLFAPYDKDPFYCKYYGREYTLQTALGLDSSFYRLPNFDECAEIKAAYCYQSCIDSVVDYLDSVRNSMSFEEFADIEYTPEYDFERLHNKCTLECNSISDTAAFMSACESDERKIDWEKLQNVTDKTKMQGICPDGWRIPSTEEWNKWIELFEKTYNFAYPENDNDNHLIFFSTFGDPSGFGMHPIILPEPNYAKDEDYRARLNPFYSSDPYVSFTTWPSNGSEGMSTIASIPANKDVLSYSFNISWPGTLLMVGGIPESRDSFHVRCIKND